MKIERTSRMIEPCTEGGYIGHYFHLDAAIGTEFVESLGAHGSLTFMRNLKKPFFLLRGDGIIIRGLVGDDFCKVGINGNNPALMDDARKIVESRS